MKNRENGINKNLIELLEKKPRLLKNMLESFETGIIISYRGTIEWTNSTLNRITGYKYEELIGKDFKKFFLSEYDGKIHRNIFKDLLHENAWKDGKWSKRKNGEVYLASAKFLPMSDGGSNSISGLIFIDDITSQECC
ncbi:PAS domain S-box protein [Wukongibacter sp. M2B1]|uniref:PAS domain S-box protein n=1 Tax=Wukongibacter sp. M2B1 TaxID=3088895 RepID=UPI003D7C0375